MAVCKDIDKRPRASADAEQEWQGIFCAPGVLLSWVIIVNERELNWLISSVRACFMLECEPCLMDSEAHGKGGKTQGS